VGRLLACPAYDRVVALVRRPLRSAPDSRLVGVLTDYVDLDATLAKAVTARDRLHVYVCLGTTLRRAGSQAAFRRVDHDYVLALGRWAAAAGAERFVVVSALGANAASRVFYNRVKGETERDLSALGLRRLVVMRPSLLLGERSEFRLGERLAAQLAGPVRAWLPARVRPVTAEDVAQAMIDAALADAPPAVIESAAMQGAAERAR
jgi:uncharacterized protein YbjT (DUF2867 family)